MLLLQLMLLLLRLVPLQLQWLVQLLLHRVTSFADALALLIESRG